MSHNALLFEYAECGAEVALDEFNDWYDNEHAPARLTVPGIHSAARYKATDSRIPGWLALYDMESPDVADSEPFKALTENASDQEKAHIPRLSVLNRVYNHLSERHQANKPNSPQKHRPDVASSEPSDREKTLIPRLSMFNRRVYTLLSERHSVNKPDSPPKYRFVVTMAVPADLDEEFNRWYEDSHLDEIARVPGWYGCRRYKLVNAVELGQGKDKPDTVIHNYLAVNEWDNDVYMSSQEFREAITSPWSAKMLRAVTEQHGRRFALHPKSQ